MAGRSPLIVSACRTPIGRFLGRLAAQVGRRTWSRRRARGDRSSALGFSPKRLMRRSLAVCWPQGWGRPPRGRWRLVREPRRVRGALTVGMVCGSGLRAVMLASTAIRAGEARVVLAGGMESMSNAPHLLRNGRAGWKFGDQPLVDSLQFDGLTCAVEGWPMGMAAERTARAMRPNAC